MAKIEVAYDQYAQETIRAIGKGLLLASRDAGGRPNTMAIGWGTVGSVWSRPMFVVLVRHSRYTHECIDATGDFTVNVPYPQMADDVEFCGTVSGRDHDKFAERGLTAAESATVASPYIEECGLVYECKVVQYTDVVPENFAPEVISEFYTGGDFHRVYFGQILRVAVDEDFATRLGLT